MYRAIVTGSKKLDADIGLVLQVVNCCVELHTLPKPGGLFEQDALFMSVYHHIQEARAIRADIDSKKATK